MNLISEFSAPGNNLNLKSKKPLLPNNLLFWSGLVNSTVKCSVKLRGFILDFNKASWFSRYHPKPVLGFPSSLRLSK